MSPTPDDPNPRQPSPRQPIFNLPQPVVVLVAAIVASHLIRVYLLDSDAHAALVLRLVFVPARYGGGDTYPGGIETDIWTFFTYALMHPGFGPIVVSCLLIVIFGSMIARRLETSRFILFTLASAAAGSLAYLVTHHGSILPLIGAKPVFIAYGAAASRFVFSSTLNGNLPSGTAGPVWARSVEPISDWIRRPAVLGFLGIWLGLNMFFELLGEPLLAAASTGDWFTVVIAAMTGLALFEAMDPFPR